MSQPSSRRRFVVAVLASFAAGLSQASVGSDDEPVRLTFRDLAPASPKQRFSEQVLALNGRRVRLTGYMAQSEQPLEGAFFLCPVPTFLDEGGGGTGDLPPDSVRVTVPSLAGRPVPFAARPVEVTGRLDLGYRDEPDGQVSWVRLTVDAVGGVTGSPTQ